jgi:hypothetical protein
MTFHSGRRLFPKGHVTVPTTGEGLNRLAISPAIRAVKLKPAEIYPAMISGVLPAYLSIPDGLPPAAGR